VAGDDTPGICLRCDWRGEGDGECPRCGAPLYRATPTGARARREPVGARSTAPAAPQAEPAEDRTAVRRSSLEAVVVDPPAPAEDPPSEEHGRARRGVAWAVVVALVATAAWRLAANGDDPGRREPVDITPTRVELPDTAAAFGERRITFTTVAPAEAGRRPYAQLWRLELPSGRLIPGPVVPPVLEILADPRPGVDRVAYEAHREGLFLLEGFGDPRRISAEVTEFAFLGDGSLVHSEIRHRSPRSRGGTEIRAEISRTPPDDGWASERFAPIVPGLVLEKAWLRGSRVLLLGVSQGRRVFVLVDLESRTVLRRPVPPRVEHVGFVIAAVAGDAAAAAGLGGGTPAALPDVRAWVEGDDIILADRRATRTVRISLPTGFPPLLDAIAAA
jgi:hypothetical protein